MLLLCQLGHVASTRQLRARGVSSTALRTAVDRGAIIRLQRGTYACPHLDPATAHAAHIGGALTCVSVLAAAGVWAGTCADQERVHVQVPRTFSGTRPPATQLHWEPARFGLESRWRVTRLQALWQAMRCLDEENAIAAMESAIHEGFLPEREVRRLGRLAPRRLQDGIRRLVPDSGSGNETITRLRLQRCGYQVVAQGNVPGMGHEDLVVEDCVGLEVDSERWHDGEDHYTIDRDRDLHVAGLGRPVLRLRPAYIHETWQHTLAVIERTVTDATRERKRRTGRVLDRYNDPLPRS
jgi:hypothetical protein